MGLGEGSVRSLTKVWSSKESLPPLSVCSDSHSKPRLEERTTSEKGPSEWELARPIIPSPQEAGHPPEPPKYMQREHQD